MSHTAHHILSTAWQALGGDAALLPQVEFTGAGALPSCFATTDFAAASVAAAGLAIAELAQQASGRAASLTVDRRLASFWFATSVRPQGWALPAQWDPVAGDYATRDGWIRLHTNAPHHRAAAERVLGQHMDKASMAKAVAAWSKTELESAIVAAGGCAAEMRSADEWSLHPQGAAVAAESLAQRSSFPAAKSAWAPDPARPLAGLKVLDLTRILAGPTATRFLAGYGAQVLRIDPVQWEEDSLAPELTLGKRCARLDLRSAEGRATFDALLAEADLLLHGYRADALERLGLGAAHRRAIAPGLIEVCLDAYGWSGPWALRRGFDSLVQMSTGIAHAGMQWRGADKPVPLPVQALDVVTGYLMAAVAVRGISERLATGAGSRAQLSLARTARFLLDQERVSEAPPLAPENAADLAPAIEQTAWGPAQRIRWPLEVQGTPIRWEYPASRLGSSEPRWI